jgi:AcrR family transcriptional regulator
MDEESLPDDVALLWGRRPAARRGPKASLSAEEITRAAVAVADVEGLAAVSMARVAGELGCAPMALYRHVRSKEELLLLMADAAYEVPPAGLGEGEWRDRLSAWAHALLAMLRRHRWFSEIPISGPPMGPGSLVWLDRALAAMDDTGLDDDIKMGVVMGLLPLAHGQARLSAALEAGFAAHPERFSRGYGATLGALVDPVRFPALSRAIAAGVFDDPSSGGAEELDEELDEGFRFAVDCYLAGVAAVVDAAASAGAANLSTGGEPA